MHELSIAQSIVEAVEVQAEQHEALRVRGVRIRMGEANGVVVSSLTACFEMLCSLSPLLEGAELWIEHVPHRARCSACRDEFAVRDYIAQCPQCQGWDTEVISGNELQVVEMEIDNASQLGAM